MSEEVETMSLRLPAGLKAKLKKAAEGRKVPMSALVEYGAFIMAHLPERTWQQLLYVQQRGRRGLTPAQQIVDVIARTPPYTGVQPKWGK
jgi:hypothetical protein